MPLKAGPYDRTSCKGGGARQDLAPGGWRVWGSPGRASGPSGERLCDYSKVRLIEMAHMSGGAGCTLTVPELNR